VVGVGYTPHVGRVGWRVLGYLPGYLREEEYASGGRFLLARALHVPPSLAAAVTVVVAAAAVVTVLRREGGPVGRSCVLLATLLLATTPVQPWYGVALLAVAALAADLRWTALVVAAYPYFFAVILHHPGRMAIGQLSYGLAAAIVLVLSVARWSAPRGADGASGRSTAPGGLSEARAVATIARTTHRPRGAR
jgi:hypothetical protein